MRARTLILLAAVSLALATAIPIIQISAAEEEGTGILLVYTTPERNTLVNQDDNERYYVVPGTEYYFTIQDITEYDTDTQITIWAYRANTTEDITIETLTVDPQSCAAFTWTIPDYMLDEILKMKYGTDLATDYYAQNEIWVNARVGNGILYAYQDVGRTTPALPDPGNNYLVEPGTHYYFEIEGIDEYELNDEIWVWAFYEIDGATEHDAVTPPSFEVTSKPLDISFEWTVPADVAVGTSIKFKYGILETGPLPNWYFARRDTQSAPRLLLVIPGVFLGSAGAMTALFSVLGIKAYLRRKN